MHQGEASDPQCLGVHGGQDDAPVLDGTPCEVPVCSHLFVTEELHRHGDQPTGHSPPRRKPRLPPPTVPLHEVLNPEDAWACGSADRCQDMQIS